VEVENIIYLHPKVLEVAVYRVPDAVMGEKAAASIVAVPNTNPTVEEIQEFCSGKLAKYKIPEYIVFTASLPKNPGGKVIKEELTRQFSRESGPKPTK
jgi:acyl-CoA synthetase (AMP-forming)/AMP-acid ligase II